MQLNKEIIRWSTIHKMILIEFSSLIETHAREHVSHAQMQSNECPDECEPTLGPIFIADSNVVNLLNLHP